MLREYPEEFRARAVRLVDEATLYYRENTTQQQPLLGELALH